MDTIEAQPIADTPMPEQQPTPPQNGDDKLKALHAAVSKDYNIGTFEDFKKNLQDPAKRKSFYDTVGKDYNLGKYEDFDSKIRGISIRQQYPDISELHDSKFVDDVLDKNKDKNFVQRYLNPSQYPVIKNDDGSVSTHRMASSDNIAYPTIIQQADGTLKQLGDKEAYRYAIKNKEYIAFKNDKDADWFATNGYKLGSQSAPNKQISAPSIENIRQLNDAANAKDQSIATPLGEVNTSEVDPTIAAQKKALKDQSDAHVKTLSDQWGIEPEKVKQALADFPDENDPNRLKAKAQLSVDNPETYNKLVAADQNMHLLNKAAGPGIAHEYNELQGTPEKPINSLSELQRNIAQQQNIIRSNLSGPDRQRAMDNLERNRSSAFNATSPEIINEYGANEEIKGQLNPMQFAGLKSLEAFDPQKYKLYSGLISRKETPDDTVEQKIGMEKVKKELLDIGRKNTVNYINEHQNDLNNAHAKAQTEDEKSSLVDTWLHNKSIVDKIEEDAKQDVSRFPYLNDLEFERQAKELAGKPDLGPIGYALNKFGLGIGSAVKAVQNLDVNAFGSDQDIAQLNLQRLGESEKEKNQFYLPEAYKSEGSPFVYKFDKYLQDQATKIKSDKNLTDEQKSGALIDLVKDNPDQVHTVTNTAKFGKSASIFSKATLYKNAGMIGDLASFAAQQAGSGGVGLPKWIASATPMFIATQNDFYKEALQEGRSNPMEYANTHAAIMMVAGAINPDLGIAKRSLGINSELGKAIAGIPESTWNDIVSKNKPLINRIKNSLTGVGKETAKMGLTYGAGTSIASDLANRGLFGSNMSAEEMADHAVKATKDITSSSIALMGLHAISNFKDVSPEEKARVWELGDNPKLAMERLDDEVKSGNITSQVADQRKQIIKKVSKLIDSVPTEDAKGKPLTDQQRSNYLYNLLIKSKADEIKTDLPDAQKVKLEATKRSVDIENNAILDPKSEKENLMQRKRELTELLTPDAEGKSTLTPLEKKTHQSELDDINQKLEDINSPKTATNGKDKTETHAQTEGEGILGKPGGAESQPEVVAGAVPPILESRHANTPNDEKGITSGPNQDPLSTQGKKDANSLAEEVAEREKQTGVKVTKVVGSDLERNEQTQKAVADKIGATTESRKELRTWDIKDFDGTTDKEWKEIQKYFVDHPNDKKLGESLSDEDYATKFLNKEDFKKWNDLDISDPEEAKRFINAKKENEKSINESFNQYKDRIIKAREEIEKEGPGTLLINHSNNMMIWDAYLKNGRQWNDKSSQDYINGDKPEPATLVNKKPHVSVSTPNIVNVKLKDNAIQERRPEEVLQREPGNDGATGGGRGQMEPGEQGTIPPGESEQPKPEEESKGASQEEVNPEDLPFGNLPVGIAHQAQVDRAAAELDVLPPERGEGITLEESIARGKQLLKEGADVGKIVADFGKDKKVNSDMMATVRAAYNELALKTNKAYDEFGPESPQAKAAFTEERSFYNNAVKPMQTEWSKIGVAQQGSIDVDTGTVSGMARAFHDVHGRDMTPAEIEEAKKLVEKNKELSKQVDDLKEKLSEAHDKDTDSSSQKKEGTYTAKAKKAADTFRKLKTKEFTFKDSNGNDVPIQKMGISYNDLVELGAKAIEKTGQIADGIAAMIEKAKEADWYKSLSSEDKDRFAKELEEHYTNIADKKTASRIKSLEKQLADLEAGNIPEKGAKRIPTDREKELQDQIFDAKNKLGLIQPKAVPKAPKTPIKPQDIATKFAHKTDLEFTPAEAKEIWDYTKSKYMDQDKPFGDALKSVASDLGLNYNQVLSAISTPKGAREVTLEMFKKQYERNKAINFAKRFVDTANQSAQKKFFNSLPSRFFNLKTYGHGTVGNITHAGPNIFRPSVWGAYWPNVIKSFSLAYGKTGKYEMKITELKNRPHFDEWIEAGLAADPKKSYDEYQVFGRKQSWLGEAGTRGFSGLNFMRYDMAELLYNRASDAERADPNLREEIATLVNHATGHSEVRVPKAIKVLAFAPGLEVSRWQRMITDPIRAGKTFVTWKARTPAEQAAAKIVARGAGERLATYSLLLAANAGLLTALGSKQKINVTHPLDSDWLKFKTLGKTLDFTGGVLGPIRLLSTLTREAYLSHFGDKKDLRESPAAKDAKTLFKQARYKESPIAGEVLDVVTGQDAMGNIMPWSKVKPEKGRHRMNWVEYSAQQLPIPVAAGIKEAVDAMHERGMHHLQINDVLDGIMQFGVEGFTGVKMAPDYKLEKKRAGGSGGGGGAGSAY